MRLQGLTQVFPTLASRHGRGCVVFDGSGLEWPSQAAMGQVNTTLERLRSVVLGESGLNEAFVRQSFDEAFGAVTWWSRYAGLAALFQSALADRSITAWVCATDNLAMLAHSFLAKNGVTPGKDVSLASFDNSWLSHGLGITSYDFGFDRMGRLAFHCLAAPQQVVRPGRTIVHAPGQLVTRASTGDQ
jgi:DNA-binding LacI/PurR family transcriptional regulator